MTCKAVYPRLLGDDSRADWHYGDITDKAETPPIEAATVVPVA